MAEYKRIATKNNNSRYMLDGKFVKKDDVPNNVKEALNEGESDKVRLDESGNVVGVPEEATEEQEGSQEEPQKVSMQENTEDVDPDLSEPEPAQEETQSEPEAQETASQSETPSVRESRVPQDTAGFGFPRKNGRTLCIFTGEPFTHSRYIAGYVVPMTEDAHDTKTVDQIMSKLEELGKI